MGWDIDVVCEYKNPITGEWDIADDYTEYHSATEPDVVYDIVEPIAIYRNYNLFRPLGNVRNTQEQIDRERAMWKEYTTTHRTSYERGAVLDLITEATHPTAVVDYVKGLPKDASIVTRSLYWSQNDDEIYVTTLDTLCKFCGIHFTYHQLIAFKDRAAAKYQKIHDYFASKYPDEPKIEKSDFRIIYRLAC